jgi:hypothetical protein
VETKNAFSTNLIIALGGDLSATFTNDSFKEIMIKPEVKKLLNSYHSKLTTDAVPQEYHKRKYLCVCNKILSNIYVHISNAPNASNTSNSDKYNIMSFTTECDPTHPAICIWRDVDDYRMRNDFTYNEIRFIHSLTADHVKGDKRFKAKTPTAKFINTQLFLTDDERNRMKKLKIYKRVDGSFIPYKNFSEVIPLTVPKLFIL